MGGERCGRPKHSLTHTFPAAALSWSRTRRPSPSSPAFSPGAAESILAPSGTGRGASPSPSTLQRCPPVVLLFCRSTSGQTRYRCSVPAARSAGTGHRGPAWPPQSEMLRNFEKIGNSGTATSRRVTVNIHVVVGRNCFMCTLGFIYDGKNWRWCNEF